MALNKTEARMIKLADTPDWDALVWVDSQGRFDFKLFPASEHVLYDSNGMPVEVLPWPSSLGLEQIAAGYTRVSHDVADKARDVLARYTPKLGFVNQYA